jgi:hypothetical protein
MRLPDMRDRNYCWKFCCVLGAIAMLCTSSVVAQGGPPMLTDDPGTPGDGHWEINIATLSDHTADATTSQVPLLDLNYGVGEHIQLKFEIPWLMQNSSGHDGFGDGLAGVKWRFYDAGENAWQVSTYPQVEFASPLARSSHSGLTQSATSYLLPFEFQRGFADFDIGFELGRWFRPSSRQDTWIAGVVVGHEVQKGFELIAELHDERSVQNAHDELALNLGARWDFSARYSLLLSAGRDVHNSLSETNTLLSYIGLQIRL